MIIRALRPRLKPDARVLADDFEITWGMFRLLEELIDEHQDPGVRGVLLDRNTAEELETFGMVTRLSGGSYIATSTLHQLWREHGAEIREALIKSGQRQPLAYRKVAR